MQIGVTDGTSAGTGLILDSLSNPGGAQIDLGFWGSGLIEYNNSLVYKANNGSLGLEIFKMPICIDANTAIDNTINISEIKNANDFVVFPNPCSNQIKLEIPKSIDSYLLSITDISGKVMFEKRVIQNQEIIEHQLSNGIYFVSIKSEFKTSTKKLIVNR